MKHIELVERGAKWLCNQKGKVYSSPIILTEFCSYAKEIPDIIGMSHWQTTVIECKVSLSDFRADLKKEHRNHKDSLGNWRFYLCPTGLIPLSIIPDDWGLLYCGEKQIKVIKQPVEHNEPEIRQEEYQILYSIARRASLRGFMPSILAPQDKEVIHDR